MILGSAPGLPQHKPADLRNARVLVPPNMASNKLHQALRSLGAKSRSRPSLGPITSSLQDKLRKITPLVGSPHPSLPQHSIMIPSQRHYTFRFYKAGTMVAIVLFSFPARTSPRPIDVLVQHQPSILSTSGAFAAFLFGPPLPQFRPELRPRDVKAKGAPPKKQRSMKEAS